MKKIRSSSDNKTLDKVLVQASDNEKNDSTEKQAKANDSESPESASPSTSNSSPASNSSPVSNKKRRHKKKKKTGTPDQLVEKELFGKAVSYVEKMDPAEIILQDEDLLKDLKAELENYFKTSKITYFKSETPVSSDNYSVFLEQLEKKSMIILLNRQLRYTLYQLMEDKVIESSEAVRKYLDSCQTPKQSRRIRKLIKARVYNRVMDPCFNMISASYTISDIRSLLLLNPRYHDFEQNMRQEESAAQLLTANILKEIPDYYPDLYPSARRMKRHFILHIGPTNSGKTYDSIKALERAAAGIYLGPLRLLAHEVYEKLTADGIPCRMKTGEEDIAPEVKSHQASTIEMLDSTKHYNVAVIDEIQMIADRQRGRMWTAAILGVCADEVHLCGAVEAKDIAIKLIEDCGDTYEVITHERSTQLVVEKGHFSFPDDVQSKDALIVFSKRNVLACAAELQGIGISCSIIYGALPYDVRKEEVRKFTDGETSVVVATDAIGMGMNLPIRRVVFLESEKFDGMTKRPLRTEEILQIGGRAGRRGLYDIGYINAEFRKNLIRNAFKTAPEPIEKVALPFPESLLGLEGSLSDIFTRWGSIQQSNDAFNQTDLSVEIKLCRFLEQKTDDKELIYKFITMPFDEDNINLFSIWEEMADCEIANEIFDYRRFIPEISKTTYNAEDLSFLEENYQVCDLLCYYLNRFGMPEEYDEVSEARSYIAVKIMEVLSKQELIKRKCRSCGRQIKWNSPYNICSECYEKHMRSPFYGGY